MFRTNVAQKTGCVNTQVSIRYRGEGKPEPLGFGGAEPAHEPGLSAGGISLMQCTLLGGLVKGDNRSQCGGLGVFHIP